MVKYNWYKGTVVDIIDETPETKRFFIQIPELDNVEFKAGQFVMLDLPVESKITTRQYSISSAPNSGNVIELIIVLNKKGIGTNYLFEKVKVNSDIKISSALGKFTLPEKVNLDICFICTGVGIAPFRSMYLDIYGNNIPHKDIYLIFGTRLKIDMVYHDELVQLDESKNSFHYIPTLSRETEQWAGKKGYVHDIYKESFADKRPAHFYICGGKAMIFQARDTLVEMGYERKYIKYEIFN